MTPSITDGESVLAIDLGTAFTRAFLFDVVDGSYHFIASGVTPSTTSAPVHNVEEGVQQALRSLQEITGRTLMDTQSQLIVPAHPDGSGIDRLVITYSAGPELRMIIAGLLPEGSLGSAHRLATACYGSVVDAIGLGDRRKPELQVDAIVRASPDLILLAGGADQGASRSIIKLVEVVLLACRALPTDRRPQVLYAGNQALATNIKEALERWTTVHIAPNIRPTQDREYTGAAFNILSGAAAAIRYQKVGGMQKLGDLSGKLPIPSAHAFGHIVRFLSRIYDPAKGVLGVDLGANSTTIAASVAGELSLDVMPWGMGRGLAELGNTSHLEEFIRWLPLDIPKAVVRDYLWQRSLYPTALPLDGEALAIEQAAARYLLRLAFQQSRTHRIQAGMTFEPILASGAFLGKAPHPWQSLLMLLDGLQPAGITTIILDQNGLAASLGAIAEINSLLPVQVLESTAFVNLGTVICPISASRPGTKIMRVRLQYETGEEIACDVSQGSLLALPLETHQTAQVHLQALRRVELEPRSKGGLGSFMVTGGACGVVIDARGRPLRLPANPGKRCELHQQWEHALSANLAQKLHP